MPDFPPDPELPPLDALRSPDAKIMNRAWDTAHKMLWPKLMNFLSNLAEQDRKDVAQNALLKLTAYVRSDDYRGEPILPLMFRLAAWKRFDLYRDSERHPSADAADHPEPMTEPSTTMEDDEALQRCIEALPASLRQLIVAHYFEFVSQSDLAAQNQAAAGTIYWHMAQARRRLRDCLYSHRA